ncbi:MAG: hypothetical protein DCF12_03225 [Snowella sp.]|jgi:hypothetical protein|nr:MAG: hypothetical protein DCF12_03225 [Snowella sp.]
MNSFNLFDTVKTIEAIFLANGDIASSDTIGVIVDIYNDGEAYEVELFGNWVEYNQEGKLIVSHSNSFNAFVETIAVITLYPQQINFVKPARETVGIRAQLLGILDELSKEKLNQVKDFAETLQ